MRRKSERTAGKKAKGSPEKVEKSKRTRSKRSRKQSTSSENDSPVEGSPAREMEIAVTEVKAPETPVKEPSPEDTPDQVWQVKSALGTGDTGEIQKLKICLTRPPSTPERVDRSPRSKRKHSRATSSSDTPSIEGGEEKRKSKHRSKRSTRESKDGSEKNQESQSDDTERENIDKSIEDTPLPQNEMSQSQTIHSETVADDTPMSTTTEEIKIEETQSTDAGAPRTTESSIKSDEKDKTAVADTTVSSPKDSTVPQSENNTSTNQTTTEETSLDKSTNQQNDKVQAHDTGSHDNKNDQNASESTREHAPEPTQENAPESTKEKEEQIENKSAQKQVSIEENHFQDFKVAESSDGKINTNKHDVVEIETNIHDKELNDSTKDTEKNHDTKHWGSESSEPVQPAQEQSHTPPNGHVAPIVINRKRRWGSRPSKLSTQKSITISTDILKDIIPDVKPAEFDEVIEEKKHKRVEAERMDRPVLPKIVIDNTERVEQNKDFEEKENVKAKEPLPLSSRKISIVKESEDIITRPPSPPRHKPSCILYITNLVRPFTLPQLKNLLQRTGRITEGGFWIDRIKSRCFVIYETEDQAVETRHALHGVTWPVSNPKTLQVDFSNQEAFDKAKENEDTENSQSSTIPGTVEDWLREQDIKRERGELDKPWERKNVVREWDVGKGDKIKDEKLHKDDRPLDKKHHRPMDRSPEPAKKFKKKEEEAPAKLLDDLFRKTKTTPCIYWLPLSAETIAIKEEQRRQHMAEHERRLHELRRRRH